MRSPLADVALLFPDDCPPNELAIITRVAHLRTLPEGATPWKEIEFEVCLSQRILTRYVWVLAAVLRARDLKWGEIATHPWVEGKLKEAVLRNKHAKRKLPTGQQFDEFVEWYQAELAARFTEILAEQAKGDAVSVRDLCMRVLVSCDKTQRKLDAGQQLLDFDDTAEMSEGQLELEQMRVRIRKDNTTSLEQIFKVLRLTTASPTEITASPDEARDAAAGDDGTLDERAARIREKLAALDALKQGAA